MPVSDDASTNQHSAVVPYLRDVDQRGSETYADKRSKKIIAHGIPGTGMTRTVALSLALLHHDTPLYDGNPCTLRRPSMRTFICAASNAGVDELLSKLVKTGVFSFNFSSVHGDEEERESLAYFKRALKALAM
jgi:AAA domain